MRGRRLDECGGAFMQELVSTWAAAGLKASTVRALMRRLLAILRAAEADGYRIAAFNSRRLRYPSVRDAQNAPAILSSEQMAHLIAAAPMPLSIAYQLQCSLGLRVGELLGLHLEDFDANASTVTIRRNAVERHVGALKTSHSAAELPVPDVVLEAVMAHGAALGRARGLVLQTRTGRPWDRSWYAKKLRAHLKAAGLPDIPTHGLRRSAASSLLSAGVAPQVVRDLMRHASLEQTSTYSRSVSEDLRRAATTMNQLLEVKR